MLILLCCKVRVKNDKFCNKERVKIKLACNKDGLNYFLGANSRYSLHSQAASGKHTLANLSYFWQLNIEVQNL